MIEPNVVFNLLMAILQQYSTRGDENNVIDCIGTISLINMIKLFAIQESQPNICLIVANFRLLVLLSKDSTVQYRSIAY
jgi:hypothetical protein